MPIVAETAYTTQERVDEIPAPNALQSSGEFSLNNGFEDNLQTQRLTPETTDTTTLIPDKEWIDDAVLPEMPNAHPEVDAATISVDGLIKNCSHFAKMYERDPESAKAEATKTVQKAQEDSALREQGMNDEEIKAKTIADNLKRAREKAKTLSKEEETKVEQSPEPRSEPVSVIKPAKPEPQHTQNFILKSEPFNPILLGKQSEVFQAIQQERQQCEKPLSVVPPAPIAEILAVQRRTEQDTIANQEVTADTPVVRVRDEQDIVSQRTDAFIHYQQHTVNQEQPLSHKPESGKLPDLRSDTTLAQKSVLEVSAVVYEHEVPAITDASLDVFYQVIDVVDTETAKADGIEVPVEQNIETDEWLGLQFEPEVIATYKELMAFLEDEISEPHKLNESATQLEDTTDLLVAEAIPLEDISQDFETFLALQPEAEEDVPLETIIEQASEQTLEQTLVQLARHLSDNLAGNQDPSEVSADALPELSDERIELHTILREIAEILPTCYSVNEETQEERIQITPEMTQKLLMLFRSLGYEQPREIIVGLVRLRGLGFLLQAMQYMCQLNNANERQEFFALTPISKLLVDENGQLRLGRILFGLIMYKLGLNSGISNIKQVVRQVELSHQSL